MRARIVKNPNNKRQATVKVLTGEEKEKVLAAARDLFSRKPLSTVKLSDIAEISGVK